MNRIFRLAIFIFISFAQPFLAHSSHPLEIVRNFLMDNHLRFKMPADLNDLLFFSQQESLTAYHYRFKQFYQEWEVVGAEVLVRISKKNRIESIDVRYIPDIALEKPQEISRSGLEEIIQETFKEKIYRIKKQERVILPEGKNIYWAEKINIDREDPVEKWTIYIDVRSGKILRKDNLMRFAVEGKGAVFYPNPIVSSQNPQLNPNLDGSASDMEKLIDDQRREVVLPGLDDPVFGLYQLSGEYVDTGLTANRAKDISPNNFIYPRSGPYARFEEVMAYYWIDRTQRFIQQLGFNDLLNYPIKVNVSGTEGASFYTTSDNISERSITFAKGGDMVDEAEDGEIIVHEYGHALQDLQAPNLGKNEPEGLAMSEGFSDYLAAIFFSDLSQGYQDTCFADWAAWTVFDYLDPRCMRRLDTNKHYPEDLINEEHSDGEIWSAALYEIHLALGRERAAKMIIESQYLLKDKAETARFIDGARAIIKTAERLNEREMNPVIGKIFFRKGVFSFNMDNFSPGSEKRIDGFDLLRFGRAYNSSPLDPNWDVEADFDGSGRIDGGDLSIMANKFGELMP